MGIIESLTNFLPFSKTVQKEQRQITYTTPYGSSIAVDSKTALTFSAVWSAIRILSETVSSLPVSIYERELNGDKREDYGTPLYNLIKYQPNTYQNKITFFEKVMMDLCTNGNSYVHIERAGNGLPYSLICMDYNYIKILSKDQYLFYQYQKNGETYDSEDVLHFKLMTQDGIVGLSPIEQCKNAIGWGMAVEEYGNTFFKNGAKLSGVLQTDRALSEQAIDRLRNSFNSTYSKLSGSNQTAVLEEGLQFKPVAISAEQAQFLASRTFSVEEVARIFNLPPHMLKDLSKSSFNNIEMQSQEFVTYTLMPYLTRIEEEMNLKLFRKTERGKKFIEFSAMGLLRGNIKDRTDYYRTMLNIGAMSINEIRRKENMNSIEEGDNHFMQLNMTTLNNIGNASE